MTVSEHQWISFWRCHRGKISWARWLFEQDEFKLIPSHRKKVPDSGYQRDREVIWQAWLSLLIARTLCESMSVWIWNRAIMRSEISRRPGVISGASNIWMEEILLLGFHWASRYPLSLLNMRGHSCYSCSHNEVSLMAKELLRWVFPSCWYEGVYKWCIKWNLKLKYI